MFVLLIALLGPCLLSAQTQSRTQATTGALRVTVRDQDQRDLAAIDVVLTESIPNAAGKRLKVAGNQAEFKDLSAGTYSISVSSPGFEQMTVATISVAPASTVELNLVLLPAAEKQQIDVKATADNLPAASTTVTDLKREQIKALPSRPATVAETLPLVPGVVRAPNGELEISGANENQSSMLVNYADVTDPATGQFGPTVPIDSVETIDVAKTPYLAQYGGFTAGVVSVETRRGGDKWHFELNDPLPEFRIRSLHLRGIKAFTPRFSINGPLIKDRLYFAQGLDYNMNKDAVRTLPFPFNENRKTSWNSFSQADLVVSPKQILTTTFHFVPRVVRFENLDFFNPQPVTPNLKSRDYTLAVIDRLETSLGLVQTTVNFRRARAEIRGQGDQAMVLSPQGNQGNYFAQQSRRSARIDWLENLQLPVLHAAGLHNFVVGLTLGRSESEGAFKARTVNITDASFHLLKRIEYTGDDKFDKHDWEFSSFAQDHWTIHPNLMLDMGIRWENQSIAGSSRFAPRSGFAWTPFSKHATTVRGGAGLFFERVPLSVYAFSHYPEQVVTIFGSQGQVIDGPRKFANITDLAASSGHPFDDEDAKAGDFAPHAWAWNIEVEQPVSSFLQLRANYLHSDSTRLLTLAPRVVNGLDALVLGGDGFSRYRQLEMTAKLAFQKERYLFLSYVRSRSRGDLSDANTFLGNFPQPVVHDIHATNTVASVPNRVLIWGEYALPRKFRLFPLVEYRTGFPYAVKDSLQQYVGPPLSDRTRYPDFFSLDASLSKDLPVTHNHAIRVELRGLNLTNHFNALAVHSNTGDPKFGSFFGNYDRRFRIDFDFLF